MPGPLVVRMSCVSVKSSLVIASIRDTTGAVAMCLSMPSLSLYLVLSALSLLGISFDIPLENDELLLAAVLLLNALVQLVAVHVVTLIGLDVVDTLLEELQKLNTPVSQMP